MEPVIEVRRGLLALAARRGWKLVLLSLLVGLAAGAGLAQIAPVRYASQATVFLNPLTGSPYNPEAGTARSDQLAALQTEASILVSPVVGDVAAARFGSPLGEGALDRVSVEVPTNSQVLAITVTDRDPAVAARTAQAFAEGYLDYRAERATAATAEQLDRLQAQLDSAQASFDDVVDQLAAAPEGTERTLLQQQSQVYASQIAQIKGQVAEAGSEVPSPGSVITPAVVAPEPEGLPGWLLVLAGGLGAAGLAGAVVVLRVIRDDRIDVSAAGDVHGVGHLVTVVRGDDEDADVSHVTRTTPTTAGYQSALATVIAQLPPQGGTVAVVGGDQGTRPAVVAAGLAMAAARAEMNVLLVTLDDDERPLPGWPADGLLLGSGDPLPRDLPAVGRRLRVLGGGEHDAIADVLASGPGRLLLAEASARFQLVVLACGPLTEAAAQHAASQARCTLVVGRDQATTYGELAHAAEVLEQLAANSIGYVVATHASATSATSGERPAPSPVIGDGPAPVEPGTTARVEAEAADPPAVGPGEQARLDRAIVQYGTGHSGAERTESAERSVRAPARPLTAAQRDRR